MRLFVASRLGSSKRQEIAPLVAELVGASRGLLRPVARGSEHLTHVFLGDRDVQSEDVLETLDSIKRLRPFRIRLGRARVFMGRGNPRLVCLDVLQGEDKVAELAEHSLKALQRLFPNLADYRLKTPHITLARFSRRARRRDGRQVEADLASRGLGSWQGEDWIGRVDVVRSELSQTGARYETLGSVELSPRVSG